MNWFYHFKILVLSPFNTTWPNKWQILHRKYLSWLKRLTRKKSIRLSKNSFVSSRVVPRLPTQSLITEPLHLLALSLIFLRYPVRCFVHAKCTQKWVTIHAKLNLDFTDFTKSVVMFVLVECVNQSLDRSSYSSNQISSGDDAMHEWVVQWRCVKIGI